MVGASGLLFFLGGYFQASVCALQIASRPLEIFFRIAFGNGGLSALFGFLGASSVNFFGAFGSLCQDSDLVRQHFRESPGYREVFGDIVFAISNFSDCKFGNQRSVSRQDAQIPILAGNLHFFRHVADDHLLRGDNFELESISHMNRRWSFVVGTILAARCLADHESRTTNDRFYAAAFNFSAASRTSSIWPFM